MPRYRLRTLLIVLALGPPMLAGGWWFVRWALAFEPFAVLVSAVLVALPAALFLGTFAKVLQIMDHEWRS
jgi:hypothetical protein